MDNKDTVTALSSQRMSATIPTNFYHMFLFVKKCKCRPTKGHKLLVISYDIDGVELHFKYFNLYIFYTLSKILIRLNKEGLDGHEECIQSFGRRT
jgi:hypothetical protein